jgi:hypothetical protein
MLPVIDDMHKMDGMAITELDGHPRKGTCFLFIPCSAVCSACKSALPLLDTSS